MATLSLPSCPGVPASFSSQTLVVPYNDRDSLERLFFDVGREIAAIIVEPIAANMGVVLPQPNFLGNLAEIARHYGARSPISLWDCSGSDLPGENHRRRASRRGFRRAPRDHGR